MDKKIKILLSVVVFLGLISGVFLFFGKKKTAVTAPVQNASVNKPVGAQVAGGLPAVSSPSTSKVQEQKAPILKKKAVSTQISQTAAERMKNDWQACKNKTMEAGKALFWNLAILEEIPQGGTYAKGNIVGQKDFSVRITIKAGVADVEKIKSRIVLNKNSFLRGTCIGLAPDGAVAFETY